MIRAALQMNKVEEKYFRIRTGKITRTVAHYRPK
jgi:hypothetical protein